MSYVLNTDFIYLKSKLLHLVITWYWLRIKTLGWLLRKLRKVTLHLFSKNKQKLLLLFKHILIIQNIILMSNNNESLILF